MRILRNVLLLLSLVILSAQRKLTARELWKQQMSRLDEVIEENRISTNINSKLDRAIGLPHFDIELEGEADKITVHTLRPGDIDVIGAMGDSLTAGTGAEADTVAGLAIEYRTVVFSAGGAQELEQSITLPNILKKFNPKIDGYSFDNGPLFNQYPYGFNVAVPGARAHDMLGQAEDLIKLLKADNRTNYDHDWKLITLFIGGNDLCAIGRDPDGASPETYVAEIKKAVDLLHDEVPRMFLNIVDILEIYLLPQVGYGYGSTATCRTMQQTFCGYVVDAASDPDEQERLIAINKQYQIQLKELIDSGIYDTRDDFTAVIQPFLRDSVLPYTEDGEVDATYFAPDCFHFSDIGHAMGAINLWNNMLEPVGMKSTVWDITDLKVPTKEHPYLFTSKNSDLDPGPTKGPETDIEVPLWVKIVVPILVVVLLAEAIALICLAQKRGAKPAKIEGKMAYDNNGKDTEKIEAF